VSVFARAASRGGKSTTPLICRVDSMLPPLHSSSLQAPSSLQVQTAFLSHVGLAVASPTPRSGMKEIVKDPLVYTELEACSTSPALKRDSSP
jgi:hypothetical protein